MRRLVALALCGLTATATAEPLTGKVLDRKSGALGRLLEARK